METILFYAMATLLVGSALGVVLLRNVLHSALFLGLSLAWVGGLFALSGAEFLFVSQILIYVGGVAVLILFVVLLSGRAHDLKNRQLNDQWLAALVVLGVTLGFLFRSLSAYSKILAKPQSIGPTASLGKLLLTDFLVPFEMVSLLLLVALMGAVLFSRAE